MLSDQDLNDSNLRQASRSSENNCHGFLFSLAFKSLETNRRIHKALAR